jgi:hypothetical protein
MVSLVSFEAAPLGWQCSPWAINTLTLRTVFTKLNVQLAFEKQLFTEWIFPPIVGSVIVVLRPESAGGYLNESHPVRSR